MSLSDQFAQDVAAQQGTQPTPNQGSPSPLASQFLAESNPAFFTDPDWNPVKGNSALENAQIGTGKAFSDIGHGIAQRYTEAMGWLDRNLPGQDLRQRIGESIGTGTPTDWQNAVQANIDEHRKLDEPLAQTGGGKVGNIVGDAAIAAPAMLIPGGQTLAGSVLTGGTLSALQPTATGESVVANGLKGMAGGAAGYGVAKYAVPAAVSWFKGLMRGPEEKAGQAIVDAAGGEGPAQDAIENLSNAQPIVPGSNPTAAQAAQNGGIAALQRTVSQTDPKSIAAYAQRAADQNAARVGALKDMAGSDGARDFYAADRATTGKQMYQEAFQNGPDPSTMTPWLKGQVTQLLKRPSIQAAAQQAKNLAAEEGIQLNDTTSLQGMHYMKMALDDQIAASARAGADAQTRALQGTKDMLLGVMDKMSPEYAQARLTFQQMSRPINQMDVAQSILDKSTNALTENLKPEIYARNLSDYTAKRATGFNGATLENTMEPGQLQTLNAIRDDLASSVYAQNAGRGAGSDTMQKSALASALSNLGSNLLNMTKKVPGSNFIYDNWNKIGGAEKAAIAQKLSEGMLDPQETARLMQQAIAFSPSTGISGIINGAAKKSAPTAGIIAGAMSSRPTTISDGPQQ